MVQIIESNKEKQAFLEVLNVRGKMDTGEYAEAVKKIVEDVRLNGDEALLKYTQKWDCESITLENIKIAKEELKKAYDELDDKLKEAMTLSRDRIAAFHEKQKQNTWIDINENGEILGQRVIPLETVGVYVPGGKAAYPSTALMNIMPAKVAGVKKIVMVTPAVKGIVKQEVLAAAYLAGVDEVYKIGGAQAIATLAFGTNTIPKVDKIVGPGNIYVELAKLQAVCGHHLNDKIF